MEKIDGIVRDLEAIRLHSPLIHNITNYVVMNNTANALLAIGASPVMAHAREEAAEMAGLASAVVLNIGTLEPAWVEAMLVAGETALEKETPVIFDPVGAGATAYRNEVCKEIIERCAPTIIRGNASEIMALYNVQTRTKGVDSTAASGEALESARQLAVQTNAAVVISGETDYITNGQEVHTVANGSALMPRVTGMGCTASAITGAFAAVNPDPFLAATHAMYVMGIAGERAAGRSAGTGSLQMNFLDELYNLNEEAIRATIR
ncbi:MAG: hydroxyethylthiazole kinase [Tannerellaceae bacterium]|nr:hydroxyethylthiazole kinase [Tannerellaceae bacterium]